MRVDILGIYPVDAPEPCHLIELMVRDYTGVLDVGAFTQERLGQPTSNWQVPWDERVLSPDGSRDLLGPFPAKIQSDGTPLRLAFFFHYLDLRRPLITPAGELALRAPQEMPDRLAFLTYEGP